MLPSLEIYEAPNLSGKFKSKPVGLSGKLTLPNGEGEFPVVILQHGTGDNKKLKKWYLTLTKSLLNNGIGVFINDSYKNRKIKGPELTDPNSDNNFKNIRNQLTHLRSS